MSIKWRNKIFKAGIVSLAFLLTINPLDLNSVIRANEDNDIKGRNNSNIINNNVNSELYGNGKIDMKQRFYFKGIARKDSRLSTLSPSDISKTAAYIPEDYSNEKTANTAKILTTNKVAGRSDHDKQTVLANSNIPINLRRDFEIEASFSLKNKYHGFVFALHGDQNYNPQGTDNSLGVYFDPTQQSYTIGGLKDAFIMEVDTYDDNKTFGDNYVNGNSHVAYTETSLKGELKYQNGDRFTLGNSLKHIPTDSAAVGNLFTMKGSYGRNNHVYFTFKWDASTKKGSVSFKNPGLSRYNLEETYINNLRKLQERGNGEAYISIGGTTDWAGQDFMEIGVHRIKYNDLTPSVRTEVLNSNNEIVNSVYPGQKIKVRNRLQNTTYLSETIDDNLYLNLLYLQFLNNDEISQTIHASNNLTPIYNVKKWIQNKNGYKSEEEIIPEFSEKKPVRIKFPSESNYFYLEYEITVPQSIDKPDNYVKDFYLFFQTGLAQHGLDGIGLKEKHQVRLKPKIESTINGTTIKEKHEVFKHSASLDGTEAKKVDVLFSLWDQLYVTSSVDNKEKLYPKRNETFKGTKVNKKYFLRIGDSIRSGTTDQIIPERLPQTSSVTLALEVVDAKIPTLKSYYYRTIIIGDKFSLSDDGDYLIYGNNLKAIKDTELNAKTKQSFIDYVNLDSSVKAIKRDAVDAAYSFSNFSKVNTSIDIKQNWIVENMIDISANNDFTDKNEILTLYIDESRNTKLEVNLIVKSNSIQKDDLNNNLPNGKTAYVIIPSQIKVNDNPSNHDRIIGHGDVFISGYKTNKAFDVWVQKNIILTGNGKNISLTSHRVNGESNGPSNSLDKEYIGVINKNRSNKNPLKFTLEGDRYKDGIMNFKGNLTFFIRMK